ncbi:hypothetical protein [Streptomyces sp. I05A-00742]|uniref:hypothetical protein n=1 Tax=Streptomyces sp. I05A-00742 TaxID=2732853 RepID=UPI001489E1AA|nr:hypothetical protein [Streptomyces sp. I05A-00742]
MRKKWGIPAATVTVLGALVTGCGADGGDDNLAADKGVRYQRIDVPKLDGLTCDRGDGDFHFGSDLDMHLTGEENLPARKDQDGKTSRTMSCFGNPRVTLSKGGMSATAPHLTARTRLYEKVADPTAAVNKVFDRSMKLSTGYGRSLVGAAKTFTTSKLVLKCQQNVTDSFPMTTCFWADYGALGVIDFFPSAGEHVPLDEAADRTKEFVAGALPPAGGA